MLIELHCLQPGFYDTLWYHRHNVEHAAKNVKIILWRFVIGSIDLYGKFALRFKIGYNGTRLISHAD